MSEERMVLNPLVSIIIPNYNGIKDLRSCLQSLRKLKYTDKEIIVVDSGSTDGSAQLVSEEFPEVKLIKTEEMGIGEANNIGIKAAKGDLIVFDLNNDDIVDENWLTYLVKSIETSPNIGVVCGKRYLKGQDKILDSAGARIHFLTGTVPAIGRGRTDSAKYDVMKEVDYVPVPMVKREVFDKIGLCDPEYYLYYEEPDFCLRAKKAGYTVLYVPSAVFWHRRSATIGKGSPRKHYYERRNRMRFIIKMFPFPALIIPLVFHSVFMSVLYSIYYFIRSDFRYLQAEWNSLLWNCRNLRNTMKMRYPPSPL
jgi:GT2 family glycosyltransferase